MRAALPWRRGWQAVVGHLLFHITLKVTRGMSGPSPPPPPDRNSTWAPTYKHHPARAASCSSPLSSLPTMHIGALK